MLVLPIVIASSICTDRTSTIVQYVGGVSWYSIQFSPKCGFKKGNVDVSTVDNPAIGGLLMCVFTARLVCSHEVEMFGTSW